MSEPMSTNDIEDVVSSVRRLVSTELRPRNVSRDLGQDKLLLTPSLRVISEPAPDAPLILDVRVDEGQAAEPAVDEAPFVDVDEVLDVMPGVPSDDTLHLVEAEWEDEALWTEPETALAELALGAEEAEVVLPEAEMILPEAEVEVAVAEAEAEPSAEVIEFSAPMAEVIEFVTPAVGEEPAPWAQSEDGWVEEAPIPFFPSRRAAPVEAATATETAAIAGPAAGDEAADDLAVEELLEAAVTATAVETTAATVAHALADLPLVDENGDPVTVLDEAALYDIVRQLIREELQGVLGERITRNVRKLVRAEINRALAARSLD